MVISLCRPNKQTKNKKYSISCQLSHIGNMGHNKTINPNSQVKSQKSRLIKSYLYSRGNDLIKNNCKQII